MVMCFVGYRATVARANYLERKGGAMPDKLQNWSLLGTVVGLSALLFSGGAYALDEATGRAIGKAEYQASCAACHGLTAVGDGPVAGVLTKPPSNLTLISKKNNGIFPVDVIYHTIDGRGALGPHGNRQMPVWGNRYQVESLQQIAGIPHDVSRQAIVHGRILSLVYYLQSIQTK